MTRLFWGAAFIAAWISTSPAFADATSATSAITLLGTVPSICALPTPVAGGAGNFASTSATNGKLTFDQFTAGDGTHAGQTLTLTFPKSICNYSAYLGLSSAKGGMKPSGTAINASFASIVHYTVTATWGSGGPTTTLTTSAGAKGNNNTALVAPTSADLVLTITTTPTTIPLVADGTPFTDILTLQIGTQL